MKTQLSITMLLNEEYLLLFVYLSLLSENPSGMMQIVYEYNQRLLMQIPFIVFDET